MPISRTLRVNLDPLRSATIGTTLDGGGQVISTGLKCFLKVRYACTIVGWALLADQVGSIKVDVWKDSFANYPPTDADTICGGNEPEISAAQKAESTDLSAWSPSATKDDVLAFYVDSCSNIRRVILQLDVLRT